MSNPLMSILGQRVPQQNRMNAPTATRENIWRQFLAFLKTCHEDPPTKIQELLDSGAINQTQLNQVVEYAKQYIPINNNNNK